MLVALRVYNDGGMNVVWCGAVRCGVLRCDVVWCDAVQCCMEWCGLGSDVVWYGVLVFYGDDRVSKWVRKQLFLSTHHNAMRKGINVMWMIAREGAREGSSHLSWLPSSHTMNSMEFSWTRKCTYQWKRRIQTIHTKLTFDWRNNLKLTRRTSLCLHSQTYDIGFISIHRFL